MAPPSIPNAVDRVGYWGVPTSTLDWCEYNYEVTSFIAEFWNTVSNLFMIIPPLLGIYIGIKHNFGLRLQLCYLALLVVGIGSWLFHMSLLYETQLMDELPMVWGTLVSIYVLFDINGSETQVNVLLMLGLLVYGLIVTVVYVVINVPVFHEVAYGILVGSLFIYSIILVRRKYFEALWFYLSICFYAVGFLVWNVDNAFCGEIRSLRANLPAFARPFTQLHAWWHFFAGYGTYISILYLCQGRLKATKRDSSIRFGILGLYLDVKEERNESARKSLSHYVQVGHVEGLLEGEN